MGKQQRARELLAAEVCNPALSSSLQAGAKGHDTGTVFTSTALRAIAAALPDEQPAQGEVREKIKQLINEERSNIYWAVEQGHDYDATKLIDAILRLFALSVGRVAEELVADMRERAAKAADRANDGLTTTHTKIAALIRALPTTGAHHAQ